MLSEKELNDLAFKNAGLYEDDYILGYRTAEQMPNYFIGALADIELQIMAEIRAEQGMQLSEFGEGANHARHEILSYVKLKAKEALKKSRGEK